MRVPVWVHETATLFWEAAGVCEEFPRALREPICRSSFELTIKELPDLSAGVVERYFARLGPGWTCAGPDRAVRACLAARDGAGFILLDASDSPVERTYSLAHELAHFLWHYWRLRQRLVMLAGYAAAGAFDGKRRPAAVERLSALLSNAPLGPHLHLMNRGSQGQLLEESVAIAEEEADRLAYELLAPADSVSARWRESQAPASDRRTLASMLGNVFGLPPHQADRYGALLLPPTTADPFIRALRGKQ
jgi:hypothetical protein